MATSSSVSGFGDRLPPTASPAIRANDESIATRARANAAVAAMTTPLGRALPISDEAADRIVATGMDADHAASRYRVSPVIEPTARLRGRISTSSRRSI